MTTKAGTGVRPLDVGEQRAGVPAARVIAIANQKGGVGKSTTAVNLGASLAEAGQRILIIDLDPQGNASTGVGIGHSERESTIYQVLTAGVDIHSAVLETEVPGLSVVPSNIDLAGAEIELVSQFSREARLARALELVRGEYDFILLDCPPSLGLLTVNALTAADELIVPIQCEYYALEGLGQLLKNVRLVQQNVNPRLRLTGIVMTMFDSRTKLADQVVAEVRAYFGPRVYDAIIPRSVRLAEAPGFGKTILQYDPGSKGAQAYRQLAGELLSKAAGDRLGELDLNEMDEAIMVEPPQEVETQRDAMYGPNAEDPEDNVEVLPEEEGHKSPDQERLQAFDDGEGSGGALAEEEPPTADASADVLRLPGPRSGGSAAGVSAGASEAPGRPEALDSGPEPTPAQPDQPDPLPAEMDAAPPVRRAYGSEEASALGGSSEPHAAAERGMPQPFPPVERLVHIVSDEWEGLGIRPDQDAFGNPRDAGPAPGVAPVEPAGMSEDERVNPVEPPTAKLRRWLFGKSKGGHA
jgi:chromosome partitioning protein